MQKAFAIVNVCIQSVAILLMLLLLSWDANRNFLNTDNFLVILIIEFLLGFYQTVYMLVISIRQLYNQKLALSFKIYWLMVFIFFISEILVFSLSGSEGFSGSQYVYKAMLFGWIPVLYCFIMGILSLAKKRER